MTVSPSASSDPPTTGRRLPEIVLEAKNLTKVYPMGELEVRALEGADLELWSGELLVLVGPSGSGKSTLLNIMGGLDSPTRGTLRFQNQDLSRADAQQLTDFRREHVGFVFQFYNLIPSLTAQENVALVTDIAEDPMRPVEALELVGLGPRRDHFPSQLSGGEQQRVAIARAVAKRPKLLFCDEPTGALDYKTGIRVLEAIQQVNQQLGTTTAVITHNMPIAAMADRVVTMGDGRIQSTQINERKLQPSELRW